ncbi:hypothetical protein E1B28_006749 [Marasmius oreades]|uniref:Uncharacterized protein n=1 Tax=Marasmius oreades TaxID=181124 RepID=A0A9P7UWR7_9AGAR|nr:uncharacterized protein E1B28_006749 [Marasmius oreades]KAG7096069.1 hypothetical protein E1B28_006749 [Marasmius oreades]
MDPASAVFKSTRVKVHYLLRTTTPCSTVPLFPSITHYARYCAARSSAPCLSTATLHERNPPRPVPTPDPSRPYQRLRSTTEVHLSCHVRHILHNANISYLDTPLKMMPQNLDMDGNSRELIGGAWR